ncbi:MAG: glycerol-3-phosphate 1-O-acyltransferase PlsY [Ruminococcus sp.]|nr:glycerol-3-phosphate 1-O-acyltransferase PlsY [Ruminococcus sp.]
MKIFLAVVISAVIAYLLGSINSSIIVVRLIKGKDIRTMGSKNAGLTNTLRCCGKKCALFTLVGDLLKGVVAVILSRIITGAIGAGLPPDNDTHYIGYIAGLFAILGHVFPIYFGFKGGKGVLVGVSTFIAVDARVFFVLLIIFAIVLAISKYVSLASVTASAMCPLVTFLMAKFIEKLPTGRCLLYLVLSLPMIAIVIWMHRSNMERLRNGTENKFSFRSK